MILAVPKDQVYEDYIIRLRHHLVPDLHPDEFYENDSIDGIVYAIFLVPLGDPKATG